MIAIIVIAIILIIFVAILFSKNKNSSEQQSPQKHNPFYLERMADAKRRAEERGDTEALQAISEDRYDQLMQERAEKNPLYLKPRPKTPTASAHPKPMPEINHDFVKLNNNPKVRDFVAIDFETAKALDPCQIGMAIVKNGEIVETINYLIKPIDNAYQRQAIAIHHITPKMTENEPLFPEIWEKIKSYFDNAYIVAHNADFDINVLRASLDYYGLPRPKIAGYICTCDINNRENLELACARYGISLCQKR